MLFKFSNWILTTASQSNWTRCLSRITNDYESLICIHWCSHGTCGGLDPYSDWTGHGICAKTFEKFRGRENDRKEYMNVWRTPCWSLFLLVRRLSPENVDLPLLEILAMPLFAHIKKMCGKKAIRSPFSFLSDHLNSDIITTLQILR